MSYAVYSLTDPRDESIRYIGMSVNPIGRLALHLLTEKYNSGKNAWVRELKQLHMKPIMQILARDLTREEARDVEACLIHEHLARGVNLLNLDMRRPSSHWTQVTGDQPTLFYRVLCIEQRYWVVEVVDEEKLLYRLRSNHRAYAVDASAYAMKDKLNRRLRDAMIAKDGAIVL